MNKRTTADNAPNQVLRPARWAGDASALPQVDRLMSLAFFPGRAPRSDAYREGCRAALEYRILGRKMPIGYAAGTSEADAWSAGVAEGHSIAKAGAATGIEAATPAEQELMKAWRAMDDRSQQFIGRVAAAQADAHPRRPTANLCLVSSVASRGAPAGKQKN